MPVARYTRRMNLSLPASTGQKLEEMAKEREMSVDSLISELVHLGIRSLEYPKLGLEAPLKGVDPSDGDYGL